MIKLEIGEAQADLSRYLDKLNPGDVILLCRNDVPVAEMRLVQPRTERPFGLAKGEFVVPDEFFEPLPDDLLDAFNGGD